MIRLLFSSPLTRVTESEKAGSSNAGHYGCDYCRLRKA